MSKINIIISDDMPQVADYYKMILSSERDFEVVAVSHSGKETVKLAEKYRPDVILMDIQMESENAGITATEQIMKFLPKVKIIMLTSHNDSKMITDSFAAGASDFLTTDLSVVEVINTIKDSVDSYKIKRDIGQALSKEVLKLREENRSLLYVLNLLMRLSKSEIQILNLISKGKTYREIARERYVEEVTIRSMVNKMKKKLNVKSFDEICQTLNETSILDDLFE